MERTDHGIDRAGRVGNEGEIVRIGPDERTQLAPRLGEEAIQVPGQELDRLPFHPVAVFPLRLEDRPRTGPERAVIQERDRGVEGPQAGELGRHRQIMTGTLGPWAPSTRWTRFSSC